MSAPGELANLTAWYSARAEVFHDGDAVGTWADLSGNSRDLTQATAAQKPAFKEDQVGGCPALYFDGGDDLKTAVNISTIVNASAYTSLCVFKAISIPTANVGGTANANVWSQDGTGSQLALGLKNTPSAYAYHKDAGGEKIVLLASPTFVVGSWSIAMTRKESGGGGTLFFSLNGGSESSTAAGNAGSLLDPLVVGRNDTSGLGRWLKGYLAELMFFDRALTSGEVAAMIAYLQVTYGLAPSTALADMARLSGSVLLRRERQSLPYVPDLPCDLMQVMDNDLLDRWAYSDANYPHPTGAGAGVLAWERRYCEAQSDVLDLDALDKGRGGDPAKITLLDLRDLLCTWWDVGLTREAGVGTTADGIAQLWTGQQITFLRSSQVWVDNPPGDGTVALVDYGVPAFDMFGRLLERGATNYLARSSGVSGTTGLTASGSGTLTTSSTVLLFDPGQTGNPTVSLLFTASGAIATDFEVPWPVTASIPANTKLTFSADHKDASAAAPLKFKAQRAVDSKYFRVSDLTWQAAETWNVITVSTSWARYISPQIDVGASNTTITVTLGAPVGSVGGQVNNVGHVQLEDGFASSRIVTDATSEVRLPTTFKVASNATGVRTLPNAHSTLLYEAVVSWPSTDTRNHYMIDAYHDASNWTRWYWKGSSLRWVVERRVAGVTTTSIAPATTHVRGDRVRLAAQVCGADGELALAAFTHNSFVGVNATAPVKGTAAVAAAAPTEAATANVFFGSDKDGANQIDGSIRYGLITPQVLLDEVIARFPL